MGSVSNVMPLATANAKGMTIATCDRNDFSAIDMQGIPIPIEVVTSALFVTTAGRKWTTVIVNALRNDKGPLPDKVALIDLGVLSPSYPNYDFHSCRPYLDRNIEVLYKGENITQNSDDEHV